MKLFETPRLDTLTFIPHWFFVHNPIFARAKNKKDSNKNIVHNNKFAKMESQTSKITMKFILIQITLAKCSNNVDVTVRDLQQ